MAKKQVEEKADTAPSEEESRSLDGGKIKLLSSKRVLEIIDTSYPTLWAWVKRGHFPAPRALGPNQKRGKLFWLEHEVAEWTLSRKPRLFDLKADRKSPKGSRKRPDLFRDLGCLGIQTEARLGW